MAKDIFDVDSDESKDLFSVSDTDAFNRKAEMGNSAKNLNHSYTNSNGGYCSNTKETSDSKKAKNQDKNVFNKKNTANRRDISAKNIFTTIKIIVFVLVAFNIVGKKGLFRGVFGSRSLKNFSKYVEKINNDKNTVSETVSVDGSVGDGNTEENITTGDSTIDRILSRRAKLWDKGHRSLFDETAKDYERKIFDKITGEIKGSNISHVRSRLEKEEQNLMMPEEFVYDCLASDDDGRYLCIINAITDDYKRVFDYRNNPVIEETLEKMLPIFGVENANESVITVYSIKNGLIQSFNIEPNVSADNKIVINGLYNNSLDKSFYQSTKDFIKEFNHMAVDDINNVLSDNRNIKSASKKFNSVHNIEGFDDAIILNGTRMLKIPNDDKIANIFKSVPFIDSIRLSYDLNTDKCYLIVGSNYSELEWRFEIEPKLNSKNKIVIKKML